LAIGGWLLAKANGQKPTSFISFYGHECQSAFSSRRAGYRSNLWFQVCHAARNKLRELLDSA
jgi:hypothetical protein